jgi:hypothetical protein
MSSRLMRWFIIVGCAKKRKDLARPGAQTATRADAKFLRVDGNAAQDVMNLTPRLVLEADMENRVRIAEEVHYATDCRLCVYGLLLNASRILG